MDVQIVEVCCCNCGISFWLTKQHDDQLLECHNTFYCPKGHAQHYTGKSNAQKAKERDEYKKLYEEERGSAQRLSRSNSALRGVITRKKKQ